MVGAGVSVRISERVYVSSNSIKIILPVQSTRRYRKECKIQYPLRESGRDTQGRECRRIFRKYVPISHRHKHLHRNPRVRGLLTEAPRKTHKLRLQHKKNCAPFFIKTSQPLHNTYYVAVCRLVTADSFCFFTA